MNDERNNGKRYNGWTNYETWLVGLWLDNEESAYRYWAEQARNWKGQEYDRVRLAEQLEAEVTEAGLELGCTLYADLMYAALQKVDWLEVAESHLSQVAEEWTGEPSVCDAPPMPSPNPEERHEEVPEKPEPGGSDMEDLFGPVISRYTRKQAIEDGVLVDVTETAKEAGFKIPVALTHAVWAEFVEVPEGVECQDEKGRLWDVIWMCRFGIAMSADGVSEILFHLHVRNDNREGEPPLVTLMAVCGPNDDASPCITIMLPDED